MTPDDAAGVMSDRVQIVFERLRREYLDEMPARLAAMENAARTGDTETLRTALHQLAGSGGSHGFPGISAAARDLERALVAGASLDGSNDGLESLRQAVAQAGVELR